MSSDPRRNSSTMQTLFSHRSAVDKLIVWYLVTPMFPGRYILGATQVSEQVCGHKVSIPKVYLLSELFWRGTCTTQVRMLLRSAYYNILGQIHSNRGRLIRCPWGTLDMVVTSTWPVDEVASVIRPIHRRFSDIDSNAANEYSSSYTIYS
jgi:hypothetical protein